jgi:dienelactone hydrolase
MKKVSRRDLGRMAAGVAAAGARPLRVEAQTPPPSTYTGPLTDVVQGLEGRQFDPVAYTRALYAAAPRRLAFTSRTRLQAETWQKQLRAKLTELVGGFPATRPPLRAATLETRQFAGYRRDKVVFDSGPETSVLAYVLIPDGVRQPAPTMVCVPGHGRGVDDIVGIDERGRDRTDKSGYQHDFAIQVAEAGIAAVAIEPLGFGCRRDLITAVKGLGTSACQPAAGGALLVGQTMVGWRVWDVMRTVDYIATRSELDQNRVGCMGISGGGTVTVFASALDSRIKAALVSGYLNTFQDSVGALSHCIDNYVPGILNWAEMYDIAGLIAPRPLFIESGERDNIFPIQPSIRSFEQVRAIYRVFDAEDRIEQEIFPDVHVFWGRRGIPFLARRRRGEDPGTTLMNTLVSRVHAETRRRGEDSGETLVNILVMA